MHIDWFTFGAQIVNFLILVGLLRWLLYRPVLQAMAQREQRIADRLREASDARSAAEQQMVDFQRKSRELEEQRVQLLEQAQQEALEQRKQWLQQARIDVDDRRREWTNSFEHEQQEKIGEARRETAKMGLAAARETLLQLADEDLQSRMCIAFARRLKHLDRQPREQLMRQLDELQEPPIVRSALELDQADRLRLQAAVHEALATDVELHYETDADLICGLRLDVGGYSLHWHTAGFLQSVERAVTEEMKTIPGRE